MIPNQSSAAVLTSRGSARLHRRVGAGLARFLCLIFLLIASAGFAGASDLPRERISINDNWRFTRGDPTNCPVNLIYDASSNEPEAKSPLIIKQWILPTGNDFIKDPSHKFVRPPGNPGDGVVYVQPGFDDRLWQKVNLPHDWAIAGPFTHSGGGGMGRLPTAGVGWYRKKLDIPATDSGKSIFLDVDGAMSYAVVWLNGQLVGGWPYGYASWRVDLTPYVNFGGENELVIRLDNPPNSSRWYPGAGIYRNVWLVKTAQVRIGHWGTDITTPTVSPSSATVDLKVTVDNDSKQDANVTVVTQIFPLDAKDRKSGAAVADFAPVNLKVPAGSSAVAEAVGIVAHPKLWGPPPTQKPNRYVAVTTISRDGKVVDSYETPFGIRTIKFDPNEGFSINGEHVLLNGVCDHHDLGALGAALNYRALQRQLEMLQDMGCNALRTSHNPPAPELLELADKMGFLVMDEMFDCWQREKTPNWIIICFSMTGMNRICGRKCGGIAILRRSSFGASATRLASNTPARKEVALAKQLCGIVHEEDPTRPTTCAMNWAHPADPLPGVLDVIGLNYQGEGIRDTPAFADTKGIRTPPQYDAFHEQFPKKAI